jgi:acetyltransferase-like isoleucine patch superfamily enzyme
MLSSEPFLPYCTQLIEERFQCKKRLHQFHTTSNPANHISLDSRLGIFRAVAELRYRSPEQTVDGHVGSEVFVETPFNCDYGYNLDIGDMVIVGSDCKFLDSAKITIGRNTRIGANVTIDTQTVPTNSKSLKGSRGTVVAAEVVVGENVYIGPNVTILAGVKIGNGAIIHPGAVVVRVSYRIPSTE